MTRTSQATKKFKRRSNGVNDEVVREEKPCNRNPSSGSIPPALGAATPPARALVGSARSSSNPPRLRPCLSQPWHPSKTGLPALDNRRLRLRPRCPVKEIRRRASESVAWTERAGRVAAAAGSGGVPGRARARGGGRGARGSPARPGRGRFGQVARGPIRSGRGTVGIPPDRGGLQLSETSADEASSVAQGFEAGGRCCGAYVSGGGLVGREAGGLSLAFHGRAGARIVLKT